MMTNATGPETLATTERRSPAGAAGPERAVAHTILAIDPGSTSTKIALFSGRDQLASMTLRHASAESATFDGRLAAIVDWLASQPGHTLDAVVGRGGLLRPIPSGTYTVCDAMLADLRAGVRGDHASNLGGQLARALADPRGVQALIVDPVATDEFAPVARVAGLADLERISLVHALNVRAVARRDCAARGVRLDDANLVVAHLGGGISIVAIESGRMVDANNANEEGPFSPERTGSLPCGQLAELIHSGRLPNWASAKTFLHREGGVSAYLGTNDLVEVERRIAAGDQAAAEVLDAMAYQVAKAIGAYATVLSGRVDAILITGGAAHSTILTEAIIDRIGWIAPVRVHPGEDELTALAEGAGRVLAGEETPRDYASSIITTDQEHA